MYNRAEGLCCNGKRREEGRACNSVDAAAGVTDAQPRSFSHVIKSPE